MEPLKFGLSEHTFDAVIVDIYCGDKFPELGKSGNFIACVKNMVKPGGLVVFNRIYVDDFQDEVNQFIQTLSNFFQDVKSLIIAGNTNSDNVLIFGRV